MTRDEAEALCREYLVNWDYYRKLDSVDARYDQDQLVAFVLALSRDQKAVGDGGDLSREQEMAVADDVGIIMSRLSGGEQAASKADLRSRIFALLPKSAKKKFKLVLHRNRITKASRTDNNNTLRLHERFIDATPEVLAALVDYFFRSHSLKRESLDRARDLLVAFIVEEEEDELHQRRY